MWAYGSSLALDNTGNPNIAYTFNKVLYARWTGSAWFTQTVDTSPNSAWTSLALDSVDRPVVSYELDYYMHISEVRYGYRTDWGWHTETVEYGSGSRPSMALDSAGNPSIAYGDYYNGSLRYAEWVNGKWSYETVVERTTSCPSLALDRGGRPSIAYEDSRHYSANLARWAGTGWVTQTVDYGGAPSLALDQDGNPHLAYAGSRAMKYARWTGTSWIIATVESGDYYHLILVLDGKDHPHIGYGGSDGVRYARWTGTDWITETVTGDEVTSLSLALDTAGRAHILYYDFTHGDLKYAVQRCTPLQDVAIAGPAAWPMGVPATFQAIPTPPTATLPLTYTWSNGTVSPSATYTWPTTGTYTVSVSAANGCGEARNSFSVTVFCQPPSGATIAGPHALLVDQLGAYYAAVLPITASRPLTFTWDQGGVGPRATYSWTLTGTYTLTVTATNACGESWGNMAVRVLAAWPYHAYLPLLARRP